MKRQTKQKLRDGILRVLTGMAWASVLGAGTARVAPAAEIKLRETAQVSSLVVLGDVADVFTATGEERQRLEGIELFPAPAGGGKRFLRAREIQDMLLLRGVNLAEHRFSGASVVEISAASAAPEATGVGAVLERKATEAARRAIADHLARQSGQVGAWVIEPQLTGECMRLLAASGGRVEASGGAAPWTGLQQFVLVVSTDGGAAPVAIEARVSRQSAVVVAVRALRRGEVVHEGDLAESAGGAGGSAEVFTSIEEVVGRETTRAIAAGQVVDRQSVRAPLLIRRGEAVTVYARSAGLQVRTTARAQEDGSLGELVMVESLANREKFLARVSGFQEVEIYAHAAQGGPAMPAAARAASSMGRGR